MSQIFDIAYCISDNYASYLRVALESVGQSNDNHNIRIHILSDYVSLKNKKLLKEIEKKFEHLKLFFYIVSDEKINGIKTGNYTIYTWYRIFLPEILPQNIKKVLYLDADTIVVGDISDLFLLNMENKAIAAVVDDRAFEDFHYNRLGYNHSLLYICAGVLLMNLDIWRRYLIQKKIVDFAFRHPDILRFPDQDAINIICKDSKIILPLKYNLLQWHLLNPRFYTGDYLFQLEEAVNNPVIIHYAFTLPWYKDSQKHIFDDLWHLYNLKSGVRIRMKYKQKGINKIKAIVWELLHPYSRKPIVSLDEVKEKIKILSNKK